LETRKRAKKARERHRVKEMHRESKEETKRRTRYEEKREGVNRKGKAEWKKCRL
jgi:hypothetical protein